MSANGYLKMLAKAKARRAEIHALRKAGATTQDIMRRYKISRQRVGQILKAAP